MDVSPPSRDFTSITPDVNLMSDEFNFSPISEEARESGDGDSGPESKENPPQFDKTHNQFNLNVVSTNLTDSRGLKKLRDKRTSKIPIRQSKLQITTSECHSSQKNDTYEKFGSVSSIEGSGGINHTNVNMKTKNFIDNLDNTSWDLKQVQTCGDGSRVDSVEKVSECNRLPILEGFTSNQSNDENENGIQTGLKSLFKKDLFERHLIEQSCNDFKDIFKDLSKSFVGEEDVAMPTFNSLSPRAPLAASDDLDVPILEAPEEFRCLGEEVCGRDACITVKQVDIDEQEERHIGSTYRDCDNACIAETGDTSRRTTEEDEGDHGSASIRQIEVQKSTNINNNHVLPERNNAVVTEGHVGSTAPVQIDDGGDSDTSRANVVAADKEMNELFASEDERTKPCIIEGVELNTVDSTVKVECAGVVNVWPGRSSSAEENSACVSPCADEAQSEATTGPSIEIGVAKCAQASGCSRVSTAKVCVALDSGQQNSICSESERTKDETNTNEIDQAASLNSQISKTTLGAVSSNESETTQESCNKISVVNSPASKHLSWSFKNGRLVFDVAENSDELDSYIVANEIHSGTEKVDKKESAEVGTKGENDSGEQSDNSQDDEINKVLYSKDLNRRIDENRSRLKYLEQKLKEAGITDEETLDEIARSKHVYVNQHKSKNGKTIEQVVDKLSTIENKNPDYDANQNILKNQNSIINPSKATKRDSENDGEIIPEGTDALVFTAGDFCEFDVRQVDTFSGFNGYWEVYDELANDSGCEENEEQKLITSTRITGSTNKMGIDGERAKHNPDRDNLKSLLKRPGKTKDKRSNRVVFNENRNEFFDADYIILIREECDYDDEDDDGVCTCNQHEMVRLTCCEPNCNCNVYDGYEQTPQSPKFAPPLEFVDAVTLSPPEGYKDMELEEQQLLALQQIARRGQRTAVCRECSVTHDDFEDEGDGSLSDNEVCVEPNSDHEEPEEKEKTDQSQQTTPTTPPNDSDSPNSQNYILETITMTTVTEQRILREMEEERKSPNPPLIPGGSPINGILKGGKLWKQQSLETNTVKPPEPPQTTDSNIASDEEGSNRRSVRFIESNQNKRDVCDGASDNVVDESNKQQNDSVETKENENSNTSVSPESMEMMLTFKLGNHVLISNNSLKPNSAVRQLFPCTKQLNGKPEDESIHQYLVTAESLRAFEEAKRSKLPQVIQSGETDESIKRAIERNTLRRSLIRYEPRSKKNVQKTDNSLVERIKQLTCDVDDINQTEEIPFRASPPGEEARNSPEVNQTTCRNSDKSFSPSSSSTASSNSSSMSSTYKKITDLFGKRDKISEIQSNVVNEIKPTPSLPDLGNGSSHMHEIGESSHPMVSKVNSSEPRKQFLSTLAPLTACVSGLGNTDDYYYHISNHNQVGERSSLASSVGTEYSLEDIDEGLKNLDEDSKKIAPDVLAGTPSASESGDELAMFVQQDASRIERIKKKYQPEQSNKDDEDDEHDDYGFNRRPSVRGIKPRFGSTTEILQQIQNQLQPPTSTARVAWPYYSESGLTGVDNSKSRNMNQNMPNYQYSNVPEDVKTRNVAPHYRPTSLQDDNIYPNCANQRCVRETYRANGNQTYSSFVKVGGSCTEYYQSVPRTRNGRPQSPPPLELSKNYHQTMVYIPYNHIEGYQPTPYYQSNDYVRVSNQNQINKRYIEPIYQHRIHHTSQPEEHHYASSNMLPPMPLKPVIRIPLSQQPHLMTSRSESPVPGQFSTARSTQTPLATASTCSYYPGNPRYRPMVGPAWPNDCNYVTKTNRHSFPSSVPRYPPADSISLTDSDSQHSVQLPNGYRQSVEINFTQKDSLPNSPTKPRFLERGVPEGAAASIPSQDVTVNTQNSSSTMTSPTSPQNPPHTNQKPLFYAMNV